FQKGEPIPYIWTSGSFGAFVWFGGLGLVLAILIFSRNSHYRKVAKLGLAPVLFNIGEPVNYGLPVVLNPLLFIPFVLSPVFMATVAYWATSWGLVSPVTQNVTWVMPPILYGFFSTAFDWRAIILSVVCLIISVLTYFPFVKMADKTELS
ncbi:PTS transporter subunit EIIC, partial [Streptococcus pneumoniae]